MTGRGPVLQEGQPVHVQWGHLLLKGHVQSVGSEHVTLAFQVPFEDPGVLVTTWPSGQTTVIESSWFHARQRLEIRLPAPEGLQDSWRPGTAPLPSGDKRGTVRLDLQLPVVLRLDRAVARGHTLNMSGGGMLVHSPVALPVGKDLKVSLQLRDGSLEELVRVLRKVGHQTFALRFLGEPASGTRRMRRIMAHMRPSTPGTRHSWNLKRP
ncbi:MAG: PilZ domain-containing protein [Candidatus Sericytochromatia bacterium]|nr:PilZ domain-containing protein [Candidatus Sericytochromatia bacterium]